MSFLGFITLGATLKGTLLTRNSSKVPINADSVPTYLILGPDGLMTSGTGTTSFRYTGTVTGATNASPIVITSTAHGLVTGTRVTVVDVLGNTAANGAFAITVLTANTFSLTGSTGNGAYTSGGTWNVSGLYLISHAITGGNGYAAGTTYTILANYIISSASAAETFTFIAA